MELAMIGLGKMGLNMTTRLVRGGHRVVGVATHASSIEAAVKQGAEGARSLAEVAGILKSPRVVWLMVPAGDVTDGVVAEAAGILQAGDTVIDGGNSNFRDSIRRAELLESKGVEFVDCGTSGGIWGLQEGYSLMLGGRTEVVERLENRRVGDFALVGLGYEGWIGCEYRPRGDTDAGLAWVKTLGVSL